MSRNSCLYVAARRCPLLSFFRRIVCTSASPADLTSVLRVRRLCCASHSRSFLGTLQASLDSRSFDRWADDNLCEKSERKQLSPTPLADATRWHIFASDTDGINKHPPPRAIRLGIQREGSGSTPWIKERDVNGGKLHRSSPHLLRTSDGPSCCKPRNSREVWQPSCCET